MNKKIMLLVGMISLILISFISAFAVSSRDFESSPLELFPGETQVVTISLQNMVGNENVTVEGSVTQGAEIAKLVGDSNIYLVPLGQRTFINISFSVPEEATIAQIHTVLISFRVLPTGDSKGLGIGSSVEKEIPVLIVSVPKKEVELTYVYFIIGLILIVLIFIAYRLFSKKSKHSKHSRK